MIDLTALMLEQSTEFYTALGIAGAVFFAFELYRSGRYQKRTLLGRLLGYAPKPIATPKNDVVSAGFARLEARLGDLHKDQSAQLAARIEEIGHAIEQIQRDVDWLTTDQIIDAAVNMAKNGLSLDEIAATKGLSSEDAELIHRYSRH